jgi:hypothetical protein
MTRTKITCPEGRETLGWFDRNSPGCITFVEDRNFNGSNWISAATGSQWAHETLLLTAKTRRWVINEWSQWQGSKEIHRFASEPEAFRWLLANDNTDKAAGLLPADIAKRLELFIEQEEA